MPYAPILSVSADADPMPRVEVLFEAFAAGTTHVDVFRLAGGREFKVRSAVKAATAGALSRIDFEVPFGVPVTYRAEMFDAAGMSLGFTDTSSVELDVSGTWVHNPLDPAGGVRVTLLQGAAGMLSRPVSGSVVYPQGRRVGVVVAGQRRGLQDVNLNCFTDTDEDADRFAALVGGYDRTTTPVLCFRTGSDMRIRLPRPLFAAVFDPREVEFDVHLGGSAIEWQMEGTEVSPPTPALVVPLLTRQDINAAYGSRGALNADNLTRLAVNRRYDLAGTG